MIASQVGLGALELADLLAEADNLGLWAEWLSRTWENFCLKVSSAR
ncbi:hypothetical protein ACWD6U_00200 [Streptomyces sp. NPDC005149]